MSKRARDTVSATLMFLSAAIVWAAAAPAGATTPARAPTTPNRNPDVREWDLPNGLKVLFLADRKAPVATVQVFYHVGSKDEHVGNRGVAHMFEHMMFKGSVHVPPEEHARLLKEVGGQVNAFTTEDVTAYHQTVPPSAVEFAVRLEAERMRGLRLFPATVDSERKVVEEEKRLRIDNNPIGQAIERFRALAFTQHPYQWTAAGVIEDLERVRPQDCQAFYDAYYRPNNATLIVVGDVDEASVRRAADTHFGPLARGPQPPRVTVEEPAQTSPRSATLTLDVSLPVMVGGYHIPRASHADIPALQVLAGIMSAGESSRLYRRLVRRDKLAIAAGGLAEVMEHPGLFIIYAAHLPDKDQAKIRAALADEIARVRSTPVGAGELSKAKNQLAAAYLFGLESVDGVARELGLAQLVQGDWRRFLGGPERYAAVTVSDVQRVAARYLGDDNLTLVTLSPKREKKETQP
ncbi:MAG: insulinase family protein [Deltaproteobacteria bacterium]|nr:insulinase family protein [Deltaproteobacteria bacterium]